MIQYKGYVALIEIDADADELVGHVVNMHDDIVFTGRTVDEARSSFEEAVDFYLETCKDRDEAPAKPFSGKLHLRLGSELHRDVAMRAAQDRKSMNKWIAECLEEAVAR